ncbi:prolipoprotein diacylglyceryl transferase [Mycoplasma sp. ATU-Cv-703]|uniref:prolipoprotein diacylglyceryl transferase n=1 Tax=Mycoplasma sp. ATU-Cv-703 TaxID=2498595 RepID=UPI000FDE1C0A
MYLDGSWKRGEPIWKIGFLSPYPITILLGVIASFLTVAYFWKRQRYSWEILQVILIIAIPSAILGARLWYAFSNPEAWSRFFVFQGMSIHGGVVFSTLAVLPYAYTKRRLIDMRTAFGLIVPAVLIGQTIGRWGNFANHEVYGLEVSGNSLNWLDWIGIKSHMYIEHAYRAPLFLYESFANFIGYVLLVWVLVNKNYLRPGVTGGLYFVVYGVIRAAMEPIRDPKDIMRIGNVPISFVVALLMICVGMFFVIWYQFLSRPFYPWVEKLLPDAILMSFKKEYELIIAIKPRHKYILWGPETQTWPRYIFFGRQVEKRVRLWIPVQDSTKWSKREINAELKKPKLKPSSDEQVG